MVRELPERSEASGQQKAEPSPAPDDATQSSDRLHRRHAASEIEMSTSRRSSNSKPKAAAHSRLVGLATAEAEYGISKWTWRDLIARGHIAAIRPPGLRRVFLDRHDIEAKLQEWKETAQ